MEAMNFVEVEDFIEEESGLRRVHLMANAPFGLVSGPLAPLSPDGDIPPNPQQGYLGGEAEEWVERYLVPSGASIAVTKENGVFHLRGSWPYRGVLDVQPEGWPKFKRFVCWALKGERVSKCMQEGAAFYASVFARWPGRAFIGQLPKEAKEFVEVDGVMLVQANWVPQGCLLIGG